MINHYEKQFCDNSSIEYFEIDEANLISQEIIDIMERST